MSLTVNEATTCLPLLDETIAIAEAVPAGHAGAASATSANTVRAARLLMWSSPHPGPPARLVAPTLKVMRDLLLAVSADFQGRIDFTVTHHLDGFSGGTYQAYVILGN